MAKGSSMGMDPGVTWFFNDWHGGTATMSRLIKGCYMDLLHAQFNNSHMSLEEIRTVLSADFDIAWPTLQKKFKRDENGLYFNFRLDEEIKKRKAFNQSRRDNASGGTDKHMGIGIGKGIEEDIGSILEYLNIKVDSNFKIDVETNRRNLRARLKDGYSLEEIKLVIDHKVLTWGNDPKMRDFLRPMTIFGTKFDNYLQVAKAKPVVKESKIDAVLDGINRREQERLNRLG